DHVYYASTKSLCAECKRGVEAKIVFQDGAVHLDKYCPEHGAQRALLASSIDWYLDALRFTSASAPPEGALKPVSAGCPFDCGPCEQHQQRVVLPVVPITSACNLDCPICYTVNKNEDAFYLDKEAFGAILERIQEGEGPRDIINFTGGEPTLHPDLPELLRMSREAGIQRLTVSTNGLRLKDEAYVAQLAEVDARVVLSLDTFDEAIDKLLLGANTLSTKLRALDHLEAHGVTTTLLPAIAAGLNDRDLPQLFEMMLERPNICSLELHTLCFTGQGGAAFDRGTRITIPDLHAILEAHTKGRIRASDFVPSPLAHPHCYSIAYLLVLDDGGFVPYARFMGRERLYRLLSDSLYMQPRAEVEEVLREVMDELWSEPESLPEAEAVLRTLKRLIKEMFPPSGLEPSARQRVAERASKAIYIHSHMDEETFEMSRIMRCGVGVPEADGTIIPTCAYNVLYRERDPRFASADSLLQIGRGREAAAATEESPCASR
ncbi:MAG: radical SAM protein, partial [Myxococcales bacterium]|nr:radical SAM protein [Myxococcales bacterium]